MKIMRKPWNAGRILGQKKPFTVEQIKHLSRLLSQNSEHRNLCLFCIGIDSCLRGSDLVRLKVGDVVDKYGHVKSELRIAQQKTGGIVVAALSPQTCNAISALVEKGQLTVDDWLFRGNPHHRNQPISTNHLRRLVKRWAVMLGVDATNYSSHSLRRSKPSYLYSQGVRPEMLRFLLGHQSLKSTQEYLGIDRNQALDFARQFDCFGEIQ